MNTELIGNSSRIREIKELIRIVADSALSVIIFGETGVGKDIVARALHSSSERRNKTFVKVNCAALPTELLESELFGYEKGSFTGATRFKPGKFDLASGGVIFLDEIGDMPLNLQAKLLQVLQSGEFSRLGGQEVHVDNWVITATNHDLELDLREGRFREDLYYRLNVIKITVPPLRDRREDIPLLVDYFVDKYKKELDIKHEVVINKTIMEFFLDYNWPGNVRELSNVIQKLMVFGDWEEIKSEMTFASHKKDGDGLQEGEGLNRMVNSKEEITPLKVLKSQASEYIERKLISHVLEQTGGNKVKTAKALKISYKALFYKMEKLGLK
jgi:two-component system, NtrC family, response regulator AtoC